MVKTRLGIPIIYIRGVLLLVYAMARDGILCAGMIFTPKRVYPSDLPVAAAAPATMAAEQLDRMAQNLGARAVALVASLYFPLAAGRGSAFSDLISTLLWPSFGLRRPDVPAHLARVRGIKVTHPPPIVGRIKPAVTVKLNESVPLTYGVSAIAVKIRARATSLRCRS